MRTRLSIVVTILIAAMLTLVGGATAEEGDAPGIGQLVRSFMNADQTGPLVIANDPVALSPFGGPSQLPPDKLDQIAIEWATAYQMSLGPQAAFSPEPVEMVTLHNGEPGMIEVIPLPLEQHFIPPFRPGGAPTVDSFFDVFFEVSLPGDFGDLFLEGNPIPVGDALVIPPAPPLSLDLAGPVVIRGLRLRGMLPLDGCGGDIIELFTGDAISGAPTWTPVDFAPNDSFGGISQAHVTPCENGMWLPTELLVNQGSNFEPRPTGATAIIFPEGIFWVIPQNEVSGSEGMRVGAFVTPAIGGYQTDNTGFTTAPPYPELTAPGSDHVFIENPFPGHTLHPVALNMGDADDGSPGWMGNYGLAFDPAAVINGIDTFDAHMIQFDTYQISLGKIKYAPADGTYSGEMIGSGDGYTESYSFTDGTYVYDAGSPATYPMMVESDTDRSFIEQMATVYDERDVLAQAAETTTTKAADSTTDDGDTATDSEDTAGEPTPISEDGGTNPILFILAILILLAIAGFFWWWFFLKPKPDPCHEEWLAWQKAQKACDDAQDAADDAADDCEEAELELEDLEEERKEACKTWPPACWSTEDGGWVEDEAGNRITSRDLHMKKMALGEVWDDYRAGRLTAQQVEAKWKEMDTPEFREEMGETDEAFKELLTDIEADIEAAKEAAEEACEKAGDAQTKADEACEAADAARKAYEECVGAAVAAAPGIEGGAEGGVEGGPSGPAVTSGGEQEPSDPCKDVDPKRRHRRAEGGVDRIRVNVDFSIIIGRYSGSERNVEAGEQLVTNLTDLARDLDFAGDMLNARSAGLHIGGAANGYTAGKYVATGAGVVRGGIDATMAATDLVPGVPTTPLQAGVKVLETTTRLGAFVAGKVTKWMTNYQIFTVRRTFFYQNITATPYLIEECREGQGWVCVEKVWEIEVSKLLRLKGRDRWFTVNSSVRRAQFRREVRRLSQSAVDAIRSDAQRLIQWRAQHEAGPC